MRNEYIASSLLEFPNLLINGDSLGTMESLVARCGERFILLDAKYVNLHPLQDLCDCIGYGDSEDEIDEMLSIAEEMLNKRLRIAQGENTRRFKGNDLYIFVDSVEILNKKEIQRLLKIGQIGNAAGFHLIIGGKIPKALEQMDARRLEIRDGCGEMDGESIPLPIVSEAELESLKMHPREHPKGILWRIWGK